MRNALYLVGIALLLAACVQDVRRVEVPEEEPLLVVGAFFSPDDTVHLVRVSRTQPVFGRQEPPGPVKDATVRLSDGQRTFVFTFEDQDGNWGHYFLPDEGRAIIRPGQTYELVVEAANGRRAEATCRIPTQRFAADEITIAFDSIIRPDRFSSVDGQPCTIAEQFIRLQWPDRRADDQYRVLVQYEVMSYLYDWTDTGPVLIDSIVEWRDSDFSLFELGFVTDRQRTGGQVNVRSAWQQYNICPGSYFVRPRPLRLAISVLTTDDDYRRYYADLSYYVEGDPFSEPKNMHTNVRNGLGLVTGYTAVSVVVPL